MINLKKRGLFIVFEGLDRCGKSTQSKLLSQKLNLNGKAKLHAFPNRTNTSGSIISEYLNCKNPLHDKSIHLLFSSNRWEDIEYIRNTLEEGTHIVCDRYCFSGVAYSAAKGIDREWCKNSDRGLLLPDLVVYIDTPLDTIYQRKGFGEEKYQKKEFIAKVQEQYNEFIKESIAYWTVIDGNGSVETIAEAIQKQVDELLAQEDRAPLQESLFL